MGGVVAPDGTPEWAYDYDPFGNPRGSDLVDGGQQLSDDAPTNPMQFAGGYRDTTQGERYQLRARNYDPGTGRFDAQDPAAPPVGDQAVAGSEEVIDDHLKSAGIDPASVTRIYSERVPCSTNRHACAGIVARYTNAVVSRHRHFAFPATGEFLERSVHCRTTHCRKSADPWRI